MWRQLEDYPNYEININGDVRNIATKRMLKLYNKQGICYVKFKTCGHLNDVSVMYLLDITFTSDEIFDE
jgi:hypothetical protein